MNWNSKVSAPGASRAAAEAAADAPSDAGVRRRLGWAGEKWPPTEAAEGDDLVLEGAVVTWFKAEFRNAASHGRHLKADRSAASVWECTGVVLDVATVDGAECGSVG
uniref:Uncharacterized protein n=1 Tax=Phaeomonas parva TaxID=124430 RepID=A0A7S1XW01_9STRA|mmetsp:Transcript_42315/g.132608  ORF Transcript_42315/g.132608 Transcript_42315/m.132608 type:complete len:107 (+) Transcript_42315:109-429(+)